MLRAGTEAGEVRHLPAYLVEQLLRMTQGRVGFIPVPQCEIGQPDLDQEARMLAEVRQQLVSVVIAQLDDLRQPGGLSAIRTTCS